MVGCAALDSSYSARIALISLTVFVAMQFAFTNYEEGRAKSDEAKEQMNRTIIKYVQGTHDELIEDKNGRYAVMWAAQQQARRWKV